MAQALFPSFNEILTRKGMYLSLSFAVVQPLGLKTSLWKCLHLRPTFVFYNYNREEGSQTEETKLRQVECGLPTKGNGRASAWKTIRLGSYLPREIRGTPLLV